MRILVVSPVLPHLPARDADRLAPAHLIDQLALRHDIGVVAATTTADTPAAHAWLAGRTAWRATLRGRRWRRPVSGLPGDGLAALADAVRRAAAEFRPDVVHLESTVLAPLARAAAVPVVLAAHESAAGRARDAARVARAPWGRVRARLDARLETGWERRWLAGVSACVMDCEHDRQAIAAHVPFERTEVVPAGIDAVQYAYRRSGNAARIVFTGSLAAPRDVEAARRLAVAILPLVRRRAPRAELLVAGVGSAAAVRDLAAVPGVRVEGSLADLRPSLWGAGVYASPLGSGPGRTARLLEALALGTPVVAAAATLSRLDDVLPGHHALTAETDAELAEAIGLLMREPVVAATIARNARELVERRFTWRTVAERYEALYARLTTARAERAA
jgi:glycosyltransferase involved in cell wall biosynthesis